MMKKELGDESLFHRPEKKATGGRPTNVYKISVNQFEQLMLAARTEVGKKARKTMLTIKRAVMEYVEMEHKRAIENERDAYERELQTQETKRQKEIEEMETRRKIELDAADKKIEALKNQMDNLRMSKYCLYAFWLHHDRYKCGFATNEHQREKQHKTTNPSGKMVHVVRIINKFTEKNF